jgi:hypothetical protein
LDFESEEELNIRDHLVEIVDKYGVTENSAENLLSAALRYDYHALVRSVLNRGVEIPSGGIISRVFIHTLIWVCNNDETDHLVKVSGYSPEKILDMCYKTGRPDTFVYLLRKYQIRLDLYTTHRRLWERLMESSIFKVYFECFPEVTDDHLFTEIQSTIKEQFPVNY